MTADSVESNICGKGMEILVVDSDNLNNVKEEVKRYSKTEDSYISWFRVEKNDSKSKNCTVFLKFSGLVIDEISWCAPIHFIHYVVCQIATTPVMKTTNQTTTQEDVKTYPVTNRWPTWLIIVVVLCCILVAFGIVALSCWCKKVSFNLNLIIFLINSFTYFTIIMYKTPQCLIFYLLFILLLSKLI